MSDYANYASSQMPSNNVHKNAILLSTDNEKLIINKSTIFFQLCVCSYCGGFHTSLWKIHSTRYHWLKAWQNLRMQGTQQINIYRRHIIDIDKRHPPTLSLSLIHTWYITPGYYIVLHFDTKGHAD